MIKELKEPFWYGIGGVVGTFLINRAYNTYQSGKDVTIFNWCIKSLMREPCTCFYIMPTYSQAKKVIWDSTTNDGIRILDFIPTELIAQKNQQEMKIRFINGSLLQLIGSDNIDSLMGTNPKIVVFSEAALQSSEAWEYIRPILKVNNGVAIFISTPRGRNYFFDLYQMALEYPSEWFVQRLSYKDTGVLTDDDVAQEISQGMSEELAQQEYSCSFERGIDGAYYGKLMNEMHQDGRIGDYIHDPHLPVHTAWDLGWNDPTAIIYFQIKDDIIKIIDHDEFRYTKFSEIKNYLDEKKYRYGTHLLPFDVAQNDGLSTGLTRFELLYDMGIEPTIVPKSNIPDGITAVRATMTSRLRISNRCKNLIKSIENYHREHDPIKKVYRDKPKHDWSSHSSDALRYMCEGLKLIDMDSGSCDNEFKAIKAYWG